MTAQLGEYTKNHWIEPFKWVNYMIGKLYLNKAVSNKIKKKVTYANTEHRIVSDFLWKE